MSKSGQIPLTTEIRRVLFENVVGNPDIDSVKACGVNKNSHAGEFICAFTVNLWNA